MTADERGAQHATSCYRVGEWERDQIPATVRAAVRRDARDLLRLARHAVAELVAVTDGAEHDRAAEAVRWIRKLAAQGCPQSKLAKCYGVTHGAINTIIRGAAWGHVC